MSDVVFVTGNQSKVDYLNELLGFTLMHEKVNLDEIQSSELVEVASDKAKRAFDIIHKPVLIEDVGLGFEALENLPGPFIKFFVGKNNGLELCCRMLDGFDTRRATARCIFAYYDGQNIEIIEGELSGEIADHPKGENGWDWDYIFCPDGYGGRTRAQLTRTEDIETYLAIKPIEKLREFLLRKTNGK